MIQDVGFKMQPWEMLMGVIFVLFLIPYGVQAQQEMPKDSLSLNTTHSTLDTLLVGSDSTGNAKKKDGYVPFEMKKNALLAVGLSFFVPGAGQIYDEAYWKAPVIWGLGGYWVYTWITLNKSYKSYSDQYNQSLIDYPPFGNGSLLLERDRYQEEREKFAWYLGVLYFLNVVDAYVGANLYDFDVSPDLGPNPTQSYQVRATFHARF